MKVDFARSADSASISAFSSADVRSDTRDSSASFNSCKVCCCCCQSLTSLIITAYMPSPSQFTGASDNSAGKLLLSLRLPITCKIPDCPRSNGSTSRSSIERPKLSSAFKANMFSAAGFILMIAPCSLRVSMALRADRITADNWARLRFNSVSDSCRAFTVWSSLPKPRHIIISNRSDVTVTKKMPLATLN